MLYQLKQAPQEANIVKQCARESLPLPRAIANAPTLRLGMDLYFDAFFDLSTCRNVGMSMGPIPWTSVRDYAEAFDFNEEQTDNLFHYVRVLDVAYTKHHAPKNKKGGKPTWQGLQASANSPSGWGSSPTK